MTAPPAWVRPRLLRLIGIALAVLCALGFVAWVNGKRAQRVLQVSNTPQWSVDAAAVDPTSPTGYVGGRRWLIVPDHTSQSYHWIIQTQHMLAGGGWRIRSVDYENAPLGREELAASPFRWWLGLIAWVDHVISGRPLGQSVERAALFSDPVMQGVLLLSVAAFVAWRFGTPAAVVLALGLVVIFPLSTSFAAGKPSYEGLALAAALWSLLLLAGGMTDRPAAERAPSPLDANTRRGTRRFFILSGAAGGFGLWISVGIQLPLLIGIAVGAVLAALVNRRPPGEKRAADATLPPWRAWACSGAGVSLLGYLVEYFPGHMSMLLEINHPLYALAWLGAGELLMLTTAWMQGVKRGWVWRDVARAAFGVGAIAALVLTLLIQHGDVFAQERQMLSRLSIAQNVSAKSFADWISRDGLTPLVWGTVLPLAIAVIGGALALRRGAANRAALALCLGAIAVTSIFALRQLWWWNLVDVALLATLVVATGVVAESKGFARSKWVWGGLLAFILTPSAFQVPPSLSATNQNALTYAEGESFIERDLGHWLTLHAGADQPLVLAPPDLTTALTFFGGLRGLGALNWANRDGIMGAARIVSALSEEEAFALIEKREVTHIVIPSWDSNLDELARLGARASAGSEVPQTSFLASLHRWDLPGWLHPIAYSLPGSGKTGSAVVILEVVEEQNPAVAMSRLAEYFVEIERIDLASAVVPNLDRFPGDMSVQVALAVVETARGDNAKATAAVAGLLPLLALEERRPLPFDRRVSLAILLAQYRQTEAARRQFERCLAELDERRLRSLSTVSLYRFELLCKLFGRPIADPTLRELARTLLPPDLRARL